MLKVVLRFGDSEEAREQTESEFEFETQAELNAFMEGVEAASGWMSYEVVDNG